MRRRILFHVQHLLGIGHWRRAASLARALQQDGFDVTILSGGPPEAGAAAEPFALVQLPPAQAADAGFTTLIDAAGRPIDDAFRAERRRQVLAAFDDVRPDILLIESFPFGRRAFRFELLPLIAAARAATPRALVVASVRDVLVAKDDPKRAAEIVATVEQEFDLVLVHGDAALIPLEASFPAAARLAGKLAYTGYVAEDMAEIAAGTAGAGEVIVSAGGGAVGMALFRAALAARPLSPLAAAPWRLLTGPHLPAADYAALVALAPQGVVVERFRSDFPSLLRRCALSISQGGYNTTLDILAARARAIVVPFAAGRETEQAMRAELLARRGALHVLSEAALSGPNLAAAMTRALAAPVPIMTELLRDGARRSASALAALADSAAR